MDSTLLYEEVVEAFESLLMCLGALSKHIQNDLIGLPATLCNVAKNGFTDNRKKALLALNQFEPNPKLSPQETEAFPGAIASTRKTLLLIDAVNKAKDELKNIAKKHKALFKANPTKPIREILMKNGFGFINLKQVYRYIKYVNYHPSRIAWTKVKAYSNVRMSIAQAREALLKTGEGIHINAQLEKLNKLASKTRLIKQRAIKPCFAANLTTTGRGGRKQHEKITTSLPIFYLSNANKETPTVCFSGKAKRNKDSVRSDKKVKDLPFLKSINAYLVK